MTDIWTEEDERQLQAMQKRKKETQTRSSAALLDAIKRFTPIKSGSVSDVSIYDLRDAMVKHGGAFRDALAPFDHMGRRPADEWIPWEPPAGYVAPPHEDIISVRFANGAVGSFDRSMTFGKRLDDGSLVHPEAVIVAYKRRT